MGAGAVNPARGEVAVEVGGRARRVCLTLGALAEIEGVLGVGRDAALVERLRVMGARELCGVAAALLRGGGCEDADALAANLSPGEAARAVAAAFEAAFHDDGGGPA